MQIIKIIHHENIFLLLLNALCDIHNYHCGKKIKSKYTQLYIQLIFPVEFRKALINPIWEDELYKYMAGILQQKKNKPLAINGMPDHTHIFFGLNPNYSISEMVRELKKSSTSFIKSKLTPAFSWQEGYGAFSYSKNDIDRVVKYIQNQKHHHAKKIFKTEFFELLKEHNVRYDEKYLFDFRE